MSDLDAELVKRVLNGEQAAFEALVTRHIVRAQAVARGVLGNDPAVDDVVQESFLRAYRRLGQLSQPAQFPSWLGTIARNEAISWLRRNRKVKQIDVDQTQVAAPEEEDLSDADRHERSVQARRLRYSIDRLKASYREIINLKYDAGLSYDEMADTLNTSVANVEKRLYRARKALQKELLKTTVQEEAREAAKKRAAEEDLGQEPAS